MLSFQENKLESILIFRAEIGKIELGFKFTFTTNNNLHQSICFWENISRFLKNELSRYALYLLSRKAVQKDAAAIGSLITLAI